MSWQNMFINTFEAGIISV